MAVVLTAVPSGAFGVLLAVRYGAPSVQIGSTLVVSTVASVLTLGASIVLSRRDMGIARSKPSPDGRRREMVFF